MKRGFKTKAEQKAVEIRANIGLKPNAPLRMRHLAKRLNLVVVKPAVISDLSPVVAELMCSGNDDGWSAFMIPRPEGNVIVYNNGHSAERQESDIAHEIAHYLCAHKPDTLVGPLLCSYNDDQEEEAKWLGGCIQLPMKALISSVYAGLSDLEIAKKYYASEQMTRYRLNVTGARRIHARATSRSPKT